MNFRTDLALELISEQAELAQNAVKHKEYEKDGVTVSVVEILSEEGEKALGKPVGRYLTLEVPPFSDSVEFSDEQVRVLADEIATLLPKEGTVLVVGLGNSEITPDALGPKTISQILATRHIQGEVARAAGLEQLKPVAALAPGVLGQTGIETSEIVQAVVKETRIGAVIVVDALAARALERLGRTIQLSDSGIAPGAGVFNARKQLDRQTLGVPVLSLGVPTVVDASTLAFDLLQESAKAEKEEELKSKVQPRGAQMMVTPKEIDLVIDRAAKVLAMAINRALQPALTPEEIGYLVS